MKTSTVATVFLTLASTTLAQYQYTNVPWFDVNQSPNPPVRKEITTLTRDELTLFILAMRQWQSAGTSTVGGYYQVCGIHGAPHTYWDVDPSVANPQRNGNPQQGYWDMGYCFHDTNTFYLWHRPYLALFEQQFQKIAVNIANAANNNRANYQAAARNLRLPYWDWAAGNNPGTVPDVIGLSTINIGNPSTSNGGSQNLPNPLFSHTLVTGQDAVLDRTHFGNREINLGRQSPTRGVTYRSSNYRNDMRNQGAQLQRWTAQLLNTAINCWNTFATYDTAEKNQCRGSQPSVQSLEGIHNTVHNTVCGTMCNLDTAAYDPIFWLHHANVDRLGALWQYLNPNTRIASTTASSGNWVWNSGIARDDSFRLMPFRWANGNYDGAWWQSKWLYDERASGYTYPELVGRPSINTVRASVQRLYGNGFSQLSVATGGSNKRIKRSERRALLEYRQAVAESPANLTVPPPTEALAPIADTLIKPNGSFDEYDVYVTIDKSISPGKSFNFHCFFGDVPKGATTHSDYLAAPNRAGGFAISVAGSAATNQNMGGMGSNKADGTVPITDGLLHMVLIGNLQDMSTQLVRKYVRSKLTWRMVDYEGKDLTTDAKRRKIVKIRINHSVVTPSGSNAEARPIVAAPDALIDTTENTQASALPSGVAATTVATVPGSAATGVGPVPIDPNAPVAAAAA